MILILYRNAAINYLRYQLTIARSTNQLNITKSADHKDVDNQHYDQRWSTFQRIDSTVSYRNYTFLLIFSHNLFPISSRTFLQVSRTPTNFPSAERIMQNTEE